ncbi:uncharacterized protein BCR38DRAFT_461582 [Pseudomassariella vexata]|uniref:FAD/NAD(P)-binding domain-containing protein n=1 Tax=Pseudomassariella vexata TaxID=1141098 RepID=A0A1Y2DBW5_9PEZI|nr:uncharacterized protein BCR38DRAFT_461582 [Pseudomassariella vexata]ORY56606.1 hypothetical protein BCR38DRAFT_461582 [Pseudomassariella vexata]
MAGAEDLASGVIYDAIIVGGGPAGLSALSGLARVRRNVLLIDSGEYRNGETRHVHDVIGSDGVTPAYFRYRAREQISHYDTVSMTNGTVTKITVSKDNTFTVTTNLSSSTETIQASKIVLATGLMDLLPSTPGLKENWGEGIFWCPFCDGHEHADQSLGILGSLEKIVGSVPAMLELNTDIMLFVNGTDVPSVQAAANKANPDYAKFLRMRNVTIENRTIAAIIRMQNGGAHEGVDPSLPSWPEHDLFRVDFTEGPSVERAAFLAKFGNRQRSTLGQDMGVWLYGGRLAADNAKGLVTNIPGVYAVGDANSDNSTNVPHALYTGKRAAVNIHDALATEFYEKQLGVDVPEKAKRSLRLDLRAVWQEMNGCAEDNILYAGDYDQ